MGLRYRGHHDPCVSDGASKLMHLLLGGGNDSDNFFAAIDGECVCAHFGGNS